MKRNSGRYHLVKTSGNRITSNGSIIVESKGGVSKNVKFRKSKKLL